MKARKFERIEMTRQEIRAAFVLFNVALIEELEKALPEKCPHDTNPLYRPHPEE